MSVVYEKENVIYDVSNIDATSNTEGLEVVVFKSDKDKINIAYLCDEIPHIEIYVKDISTETNEILIFDKSLTKTEDILIFDNILFNYIKVIVKNVGVNIDLRIKCSK